ncbi:sensor histidine kinase [Salinibacter grassmerensis]|uniref:sensor histidine kinase n=1 Tax=Salinibacter grassmerensis TaxID=3040353 RepID=UPI0024343F54|nr:HAMP domain-containing sensor histidine kinase [Salinibacter grassmerensis]
MERQLEKHLGSPDDIPRELEDFIQAVDKSYTQADEDRELLERSLELTSEELVERNERLRDELARRRESEKKLLEAKKQAEEAKEQAEEAKERAEKMVQLKNAFLANMSHEIRTPLTSILGFAGAIGDEVEALKKQFGEADFSQLTYFSRLIEKGGTRLLETLEGVLNLSKLESGQMELSSAPVDLSGQASQVAQEFRAKANEKELELKIQKDKTPLEAWADEGGVQIVLQNLISNAIKYTEPGGEVCVRSYRQNGSAVIEVEDTGIGMKPEAAEDLFEPFRQASKGMSRKYEGTGVGLAVTQKAIEQMDGSIEVETQKGEGSCFALRLPLTEEKPAPA